MAKHLFSKTLSKYTGPIENPALKDSLIGLSYYLGVRKVRLLQWDKDQVAIALKLDIQLPPHGTYDNIDIRAKEDVIIAIDLNNYPKKAPSVHTDRLDFPKNDLAHLYIAKNGKPPAFCLVRGNINEWYSNKRITDLVIRIKNWLRDAAAGELTDNGEQFDPLRLEGYRGHSIYSYDQVAAIVNTKQAYVTTSNFALAVFENTTTKEEEYPSFKLQKIITPEIFTTSIKEYVKSIKDLIEEKTFKLKKYHIGYIVWSNDSDSFSNYSVELPRNWDEFQIFCTSFKINLEGFEEFVSKFEFNIFDEIPIIVGIKRPKQIIGFASDIEFVNFYMEFKDSDKGDKKIINNPAFHFQAHNDPLTTKKAERVSGGRLILNNTAVIGCGALGSKIVMHLVRNGTTEFTLFDPDRISPHNLVRHSLLADSEGMNKALALTKAIRDIYRHEELSKVIGLPVSGDIIFSEKGKEGLEALENILDFTASDLFLNTLINSEISDKTRVFKATISDNGKLGIGFLEGMNRAARVDDLQASLYSLALTEPPISEWLKREYTLSTEEKARVSVGVGCNSETVILSDEIISIHASYFCGVMKKEFSTDRKGSNGKIFLSSIKEQDTFNVETRCIEVKPFISFKAMNDESWEIRIKPELITLMKSEMGKAMPHETGGVFIGCSNYKTKTIHVIDIITAPDDSQSNPICFCRGIHGLPDKVNEVNTATGNQMGYIGEWHTHPFGPNNLSGTDIGTVKKFKREFDNLSSPLPVFLTVLTPEFILPFVF